MIYQLCKAGMMRHDCDEKKNQDVVLSESQKGHYVITLADGVTSCDEARTGAVVAAKAITNLLLKKGDFFLEIGKEKIAEFILAHVLYELEKKAEEMKKNIVEFSSTIASVFWDEKTGKLLFVNLGDGIILATKNNRCHVLSMPSDSRNGCLVTTTEDVARLVRVNHIDMDGYDSILICSDGAWRHMFEKNCMKHEVKTMIIEQDYCALEEFLEQQKCQDDYSFIEIDISKIRGRNTI